MAEVRDYRGSLALVGAAVNKLGMTHRCSDQTEEEIPLSARSNAVRRDGEGLHHITILSPEEVDLMGGMAVVQQKISGLVSPFFSCDEVFPLGCIRMGNDRCKCWYLVVFYIWGDHCRMSFGLPAKEFHITLGFEGCDLHCPLQQSSLESVVSRDPQHRGRNNLHLMIRIAELICYIDLKVGNSKLIMLLSEAVYTLLLEVDKEPQLISVLRSIGKWAITHHQYDIVQSLGVLFEKGLLFGLPLTISSYDVTRSSSGLEACCGYIKSKLPLKVVTVAKNSHSEVKLLRSANLKLLPQAGKNLTSLCIRKPDYVLVIECLPRNFGWIDVQCMSNENRLCVHNNLSRIKNLLAGSAYPQSASTISAISGLGIKHVLTIHEEALSTSIVTLAADLYGISCHHFPVRDRTAPTLIALTEACEMIERALHKEEGVLVHCQGGVGRTNTVIAAYLIKILGISASDAIATVSSQRKTILSEEQRDVLKQFWVACSNSHCVDDRQQNENRQQDEDRSQDGGLHENPGRPLIQLPPVLLLCGLAASGKSTFSQALLRCNDEGGGSKQMMMFRRVNKDDMRAKGQCEDVFMSSIRDQQRDWQSGTIIVDTCNLTVSKRRYWQAMSHHTRMWCIFFDVPLEECKYRIRHRKNHPIIPAGEAGIKILDSMHKELEVPSLSEGFEKIVRLTSDEDVSQLLSSWGIRFVPPLDPAMESYADNNNSCTSVKLHKFPRTPHAVDLGGATRDDKVMNMVELKGILESGNSLIVEEKIDGANLGIFITPDGQIITQNRSHFVTSSYHPQFAPLSKWIAQRTDDLWTILDPGRHVLFGEWMYATHSIPYQRLPGWFVAYDLFDRIEGVFYSRDRLAAVLALTSIPHIALVQEGGVSTIDELRSLVVGPSSYNDSFREGIVIRVCDRDRLLARMKLVRPDFIAGNDRWNRTAKLITNQLLKPSSSSSSS